MQLKILFYFFEGRFYSPSIPINQGDFLRCYTPTIGDELVASPLLVPVLNQFKAKRLFLVILFILQVNMLNPVHPMLLFAKRCFIRNLLDFGLRVIFKPAHKIDLFICPLCKLPVVAVSFVEDQHATP